MILSAGRIAWACWCAGWAVIWMILAAVAAPHRACAETMLFTGQCLAWATRGSLPAAVLFGLLAAGSAAAVFARLAPRRRPPHC